MGTRYEKSRKSVSENKETLGRLRDDKETLQKEYAPLSDIVGLQGLIDDEVSDAVHNVLDAGETESSRIEEETGAAKEERDEISQEIQSEIDKLKSGLDKLQEMSHFEFGGKSAIKGSGEYKKQISKFKELLGELGEDYENVAEAPKAGESTETSHDSALDRSVAVDLQNPVSDPLAPTLNSPRDLPATQYGFSPDVYGTLTYDSPMEMDKYLYSSQGSADVRFQGTCGLCSCANVLRLAGVNYSEKDMIDYASSTHVNDSWFQRLCVVNPLNPYSSGGTNPQNRKEILEHFGISSGVFPVKMENGVASDSTLNEIAQYVSDGRGVILSVHAGVLYNGRALRNDYHAVTVTSVARNKYGDVTGFYICDSNRGTSFYTALQIKAALTGADMNVTHSHIR